MKSKRLMRLANPRPRVAHRRGIGPGHQPEHDRIRQPPPPRHLRPLAPRQIVSADDDHVADNVYEAEDAASWLVPSTDISVFWRGDVQDEAKQDEGRHGCPGDGFAGWMGGDAGRNIIDRGDPAPDHGELEEQEDEVAISPQGLGDHVEHADPMEQEIRLGLLPSETN